MRLNEDASSFDEAGRAIEGPPRVSECVRRWQDSGASRPVDEEEVAELRARVEELEKEAEERAVAEDEHECVDEDADACREALRSLVRMLHDLGATYADVTYSSTWPSVLHEIQEAWHVAAAFPVIGHATGDARNGKKLRELAIALSTDPTKLLAVLERRVRERSPGEPEERPRAKKPR